MQAEMTEHLGYEKHDQAGNNSGNSRNGKTTKALKGDFGEVPLETPRDRNGTFEPKIVAKLRSILAVQTSTSAVCKLGLPVVHSR
jgi:putative transposase